MFGLVEKGFTAMKRGRDAGELKAIARRDEKGKERGKGLQRDTWIIRFPVGRHCAIEIYVGGHTRARSFAAERVVLDVEVQREGLGICVRYPPPDFECPPTATSLYCPSYPLWTLRISREFTFAFKFNLTFRCSSFRGPTEFNEKSHSRFCNRIPRFLSRFV